ncbi:MAG: rod shape-determining protein MreD [Gaiellaceae bacterium]
MTGHLLKAGGVVFVAFLAQLAIFAPFQIGSGSADVILVTVALVALLSGSVVGAAAGFWAGLLLDTATLGTLGVTSLLLTLVGYWCGRYGETTARDRAHAPFLAVAVVTILAATGNLVLQFTLGEPTSARWMLVDSMIPQLFLNVLLTLPLYALLRRVFARRRLPGAIAREVELVG